MRYIRASRPIFSSYFSIQIHFNPCTFDMKIKWIITYITNIIFPIKCFSHKFILTFASTWYNAPENYMYLRHNKYLNQIICLKYSPAFLDLFT